VESLELQNARSGSFARLWMRMRDIVENSGLLVSDATAAFENLRHYPSTGYSCFWFTISF
jgi:hypothetical protein